MPTGVKQAGDTSPTMVDTGAPGVAADADAGMSRRRAVHGTSASGTLRVFNLAPGKIVPTFGMAPMSRGYRVGCAGKSSPTMVATESRAEKRRR